MSDKQKFAFDKVNFILLAIGLAIVIIGGLIGATFFALFVFPLIVEMVYERMLYDKNGKLLQRRI